MRRTGTAILVAWTLFFFFPFPGAGAPLPSRPVTPEIQSDRDLAALETVLELRVVQEALARVGLTPDEVKERLGRLSDAERHQLAAEAERVVAGGQDRVTLLIVLILILVLILVLI